jgi:putative ABC transport system substrate-binding protein
MRRREFIMLLGGVAAAWPLSAPAQQPAGSHRVGLLMNYEEVNPEAQPLLAALREGLAKLGWIEGQNVKFEYRWVGTDSTRMQQAAKELVASQPELIVSSGSPSTAWLLRETHTIPIVFVQVVDPVAQGFAASLSRPGGNATGLANLEVSMAGKWIELLTEVVPHLARVVVPFNPASAPYADLYLNIFRSSAPSFGVDLVSAPVADLDAFEALLAAQAQQLPTALIPMPSGFSTAHVNEIVAMLARHRLPAIYVVRAFAAAGGLMSYGNDILDNYRRAATFVDRILKGEKPSELPVQFPTKFELVINLKAAKMLGLAVPLTLQASADEVIE